MHDDDEDFEYEWERPESFSTLAELELFYGDSCVDATIEQVSRLWARRSGTKSPCIGVWRDEDFDVDAAIAEWSGEQGRGTRAPEGGWRAGFEGWVGRRCESSPAFRDFVWDRYHEFALESLCALRDGIARGTGEPPRFEPELMDRMMDRIKVLPYSVGIAPPQLPDDVESRLERAMAPRPVVRLARGRSGHQPGPSLRPRQVPARAARAVGEE